MSIYKTDPGLPISTKISEVNDMIVELDGKNAGAEFDKNELTQIFDDLGLNRKFMRDVGLGNSISTYTGWTHFWAESGYSIWKYTITDYIYNSVNQLFFDEKLLVNRGVANHETATPFYKTFFYDGDYTDDTTEASSEGGTPFDTMNSTLDYLYLGNTTTFGGAKFEFATRGTNYNLKVEYYDGIWRELTLNANSLVDGTSNFASDGAITWNIPNNWRADIVNGTSAYWIRISTTSTPVTVATINYVIPNNSVVGLLALSSSQLQKEEFAWCSFGSSIYVTIRNTGSSAYEGNYFISSSVSDTNKRNYFIYNHQFKANYQNSSFLGEAITLESGVTIGDLVYVSDQYTFNLASGSSYAKKAVGVVQAPGVVKFMTGLMKNVRTVGAGNIAPGDVVFLSTTLGKVSKTAPTGGVTIKQRIGIAVAYESSGNVVDIIMNIDPYPTNV